MSEKVNNQHVLYSELIKANIQQISSRYVAMKLQELGENKITNITNVEDLKYLITTDKNKYSISLHLLDLPDVKFEKV
jgi:hypothetical protein